MAHSPIERVPAAHVVGSTAQKEEIAKALIELDHATRLPPPASDVGNINGSL